jgi:electron transport complex protein RnfA
MGIISIIFTALLADNIVLSQFQGICPFLGVSKKSDTALGMGFAVIFVMAISSIFTYMVYHYILIPVGIEYMRTMAFILIIASLVQIIEMVIKKYSPTLYTSLGVYLPLITTNCAVLGTANSAIDVGYNLINSFALSVATGVGFLIAIFILSGLRDKIDKTDIPKCFKGFPITLIAASIMALAFAGFANMFI